MRLSDSRGDDFTGAIASAVSALALFGMMFSELGELVLSRRELNAG